MIKLPAGIAAALFFLCACTGPGDAQVASDTKRVAEDFAINNVTTSLYHEFGHLLIDQFEWPVLGREENAADTIMTMLLVDEGEDAAAIAADAVRGYMRSSARYRETVPANHDFRGEHELEVQRGFLMACLLVGADRETYLPLAEEIELGENRTDACREDARLAERSWSALKDHVAAEGSGDLRRNRRADDEDEDDEEDEDENPGGPLGATIHVQYDDPGDKYRPIADLMKERRLLETVAAKLMARFPLKRDVTLKATLCDDDDAYYDGRSNEITLCYEYTQFYYDLIADPEHAGEGMI